MNPPYKKNLHLKIIDTLLKVFPKAAIVNLSPIRWLQDISAEENKDSDFNKFTNVRQSTSQIVRIDYQYAQDAFGIKHNQDLGIYYIDSNCKNNWNSKSFWNPILIKVYSKLKEDGFIRDFESNQKEGWRVKVSAIGGQGGKNTKGQVAWQKLLYFYDGKKDGKWWYEFYNKNQFTKTTEEITTSIRFDSEEEVKNFIEATSSKLGRYYYHHRCIDVHIKEDFFLWLPNYNHAWTDKELYEYFNLTDEEIKIIEDFASQNLK